MLSRKVLIKKVFMMDSLILFLLVIFFVYLSIDYGYWIGKEI